MSVDGEVSLLNPKVVAVAIKGGGDGCHRVGGKGSWRAFRWALENLMPWADRFILIHVIPSISSIPTPSREHIPIEELDSNVVTLYVQETKGKFEEVFIPFKRLCKSRKMETLILEGNNPASALVKYIFESGISSLVLGSTPSNCLTRKLKGCTVPSKVMRQAPEFCNIYVVYKHGAISNSDSYFPTCLNRKQVMDHKQQTHLGAVKVQSTYPSSSDCGPHNIIGSSSTSEFDNPKSLRVTDNNSSNRSTTSSTYEEQSGLQVEVERLRLELKNMVSMYDKACNDLVLVQNEVHLISSECLEDAEKVNSALRREESLRKIASEEKQKHLKEVKEVEMARNMLAQETCERKIAELKALKESLEKQKVVDALFSRDTRYRRYTKNEIELATNFFSEAKIIGQGAYGKVYKCILEHTSVAIKVLRPDASNKREEFLREVEVLSQLRHPHMVLLLGACPEIGCLVYEYMENGSLDDHIFCKNGRPPLPWCVRFRIVFEVACGLAFLHNSKPEPIVHRDLKPGNILLDRNYGSKIGDVGLAKLISDVVPDNVTAYRDSILAGTLYYVDPEYQRTGTLRPKSDVYALGIIILQLLTSHYPSGLLLRVENAVASDSFSNVLDASISDWPIAEAKELAEVALKCSRLRCRDRPDLEAEVLPVLKKLAEFADGNVTLKRLHIHAPTLFYCPILQEPMHDPHVAADGFTYELRAIKAWLERHDVSPVTNLTLRHKKLTPNHTLRQAIQEWRLLIKSPDT